MEVNVRLYGALRRYGAGGGGARHRPFTVHLDPGATVETTLQELGVPVEIVTAVAINGEQAEVTSALDDGDTLHVFPPAAGG